MQYLIRMLLCSSIACCSCQLLAEDFFSIRVVDDETERGVPLVELRTVNGIRLYTDSAGFVAFNEPGLMEQKVYFHVSSHGYEYPADGFGFRGKRLEVTPGGHAELRIHRKNIAERLYRITGGGIYRDSELLKRPTPIADPVLNGEVLGSDSVMSAVFKGKVYWFWGDTNRPSYPLGNFQVPGATSQLPSAGGLKPGVGVNLNYFVDEDGFVSETCHMEGSGPTWIDGLTVVGEGEQQRMFARYVKIKPPLKVYHSGIAEFDDADRRFVHRLDLDVSSSLHPEGHSFRHSSNGIDYVYFANPYATVRVPANAESILDPHTYESWSYFKEGSFSGEPELDRDDEGQLVLGWKRGAQPIDVQMERELLKKNQLKPAEAYFGIKDANSDRAVVAHRGSIAFNEYRKKWIMIFTEHFGQSSVLGEVWFSEAESPEGPWEQAVQVVTHDKYSFYNPRHHAFFDQDGGRIVYFEGTYTHTFSGNSDATPRYDYNQIMYRLDLNDPRLRVD